MASGRRMDPPPIRIGVDPISPRDRLWAILSSWIRDVMQAERQEDAHDEAS